MRRIHVGGLLLSMLCTVAAFAGLTRGASVPVEYHSAGLADVNGDGLTDFVHGRFMMVNHGGGNFARIDLGLPGWDSVDASWDVNGDGRSDFLVGDRPTAPPGSDADSKTYSLYIMGEQLTLGPRIALGKVSPHVADMNGDGKDDLVLMDAMKERGAVVATRVTIHISRGDGTFAARRPFLIPPHPQTVFDPRLLLADLNHDGIRDFVVRVADGLVTMVGTGDGDFAAPVVRYLPSRHFNGSTGDMQLADIDGDSHIDIIIAGPRLVRVLLGDGTGRFPRLTSAPIALLRNPPPVPSNRESLMLDAATPRLAVGQFVRSGRNEILAAIREGDLVVLAYENNKLREVGRTETEFLGPQVYVGTYREPGRLDVYVTGAIWNNGWPTPALLYVDETLPPAARAIVRGRTRAVRGFASGPATKFDVQLRGDSCVTTSFDSWRLTREGIWGAHRTAEKAVDLVHEGDIMSVRFTAPWASTPVEAYLERKGNSYVGVTHANTACVSSRIEVTVTPR